MASFEIWYPINAKNEGGWVDDPIDPGGETFRGVTRDRWGFMPMWKLIDSTKDIQGKFRKNLLTAEDLEAIHKDVVHVARWGYWNAIRGDDLTNQSLANVWADSAFLDGPNTATEMMQRALNKLNKAQKDFPDVPEDGGMGPITKASLDECLAIGRGRYLHGNFKALRKVRYMERMEQSEKKEKYLGWFDRVDMFKWVEEPLAA